MAIDYVSIPIRILLSIVKFIPYVLRSISNYWKRPKLKLYVSNSTIEFNTAQQKQEHPSFLAITLENITPVELHLDLNRASLNGESLGYIIQQNPFFSRMHEGNKAEVKLTTKNDLFNVFKENWSSQKFLKIPAYHTLAIPIYPKGMSDTMYFRIKEDANIFCIKKKFIVELNINSNTYHYAVNRFELLRRLVNVLVHA